MILFLGTNGSWVFSPPICNVLLSSHFFVSSVSLACLSDKQRKQGYLVQPPRCLNRKLTVFRSMQMAYLWSSYLMNSNNCFTLLYISLAWTEYWYRGMFPLWFNTLNCISNYLEINTNPVDHRILHQVIAKDLQCYDKRQCFLLDWSVDMLPLLFHDSLWYLCWDKEDAILI